MACCVHYLFLESTLGIGDQAAQGFTNVQSRWMLVQIEVHRAFLHLAKCSRSGLVFSR